MVKASSRVAKEFEGGEVEIESGEVEIEGGEAEIEGGDGIQGRQRGN